MQQQQQLQQSLDQSVCTDVADDSDCQVGVNSPTNIAAEGSAQRPTSFTVGYGGKNDSSRANPQTPSKQPRSLAPFGSPNRKK